MSNHRVRFVPVRKGKKLEKIKEACVYKDAEVLQLFFGLLDNFYSIKSKKGQVNKEKPFHIAGKYLIIYVSAIINA